MAVERVLLDLQYENSHSFMRLGLSQNRGYYRIYTYTRCSASRGSLMTAHIESSRLQEDYIRDTQNPSHPLRIVLWSLFIV